MNSNNNPIITCFIQLLSVQLVRAMFEKKIHATPVAKVAVLRMTFRLTGLVMVARSTDIGHMPRILWMKTVGGRLLDQLPKVPAVNVQEDILEILEFQQQLIPLQLFAWELSCQKLEKNHLAVELVEVMILQ